MRKLQDQNEAFQSNRAKMAEGMALALEKKDQEWIEKLATLEQVKILCNILDKGFMKDCRAWLVTFSLKASDKWLFQTSVFYNLLSSYSRTGEVVTGSSARWDDGAEFKSVPEERWPGWAGGLSAAGTGQSQTHGQHSVFFY